MRSNSLSKWPISPSLCLIGLFMELYFSADDAWNQYATRVIQRCFSRFYVRIRDSRDAQISFLGLKTSQHLFSCFLVCVVWRTFLGDFSVFRFCLWYSFGYVLFAYTQVWMSRFVTVLHATNVYGLLVCVPLSN